MCCVILQGGRAQQFISRPKGEKTVKYGKRIRFGTTGKHLHREADKRQNKIKADRYINAAMGLTDSQREIIRALVRLDG